MYAGKDSQAKAGIWDVALRNQLCVIVSLLPIWREYLQWPVKGTSAF